MNVPVEPAAAAVYPACHASTTQMTTMCGVSLRSPPCGGLAEELLNDHLSNTGAFLNDPSPFKCVPQRAELCMHKGHLSGTWGGLVLD